MFALIDASGMYASCEKVFDPSIRNRPVVVLSNNDGCIVAVCPIAKKLGIPKFQPYFKLKPKLDELGVIARSSNYELYSDLSQRMMNVCARFAPEQHIYSIDENFLSYGHYIPKEGWLAHGKEIRRAVWRETRLPVGVGFGCTLTLAKAANHASKRVSGYQGVAVIASESERVHILQNMLVSDVWGIGRRISKRLVLQGIDTAWQLSKAMPSIIKKDFSILISHTVHELNGNQRFSWDEVKAPKKQIFSTRSFGKRVTNILDLKQAIIMHCGIASKKLRSQNSQTLNIIVFAHNSIHDKEPFFRRAAIHQFSCPTSDSGVISSAAGKLVDQIFKPGIRFYKAGIGLLEIVDEKPNQQDLFAVSNDRPNLMTCMDGINDRYGKNTIFIAGQGIEQKFAMRRELLSPRYTTRLAELPIFRCN
jgi:DNA polymerase V